MDIVSNPILIQYMNDLEIVISESGFATLDNSWYCGDVCSPFSRVYFIQAGEGTIICDEHKVCLKPDNCYLIPANTEFSYECSTFLNQLFFHVHVYSANGCDLMEQINGFKQLPLEKEEIDAIIEVYRSDKICSALKLQQYLQGIVARFIEHSDLGKKIIIPDSQFLNRLYAIVAANLSIKTTQADIARKMSISPRNLANRFKEETGITLGRYINSLLFRKAQQLLISSDAPIYEISEALGFCDQFYFSRFFFQRQQETPSDYRRHRRGRI